MIQRWAKGCICFAHVHAAWVLYEATTYCNKLVILLTGATWALAQPEFVFLVKPRLMRPTA